MADPTRYLTVPEAMLMRWWNTQHKAFSIFAAPVAITPTPDKRIIIQFISFFSDMTTPLVTISCTGVDSVVLRYAASAPWRQAEAIFCGATNEDVTFTAGTSGGTASDIWVSYYEL